MKTLTGRPAEILLIEDNPGDIELTRYTFQKAKLKNNLHVARDGEEGLDALYKRNGFESMPTPDLILLDLNMPRKDGREVLAEIKEDPELRMIPVVIMTSSQAEADLIASYNLHANSYVLKPICLKEFSKIVDAIEDFWFSIVVYPNSD